MLYEYAVEPTAISANWQTCRYLAEKFGFDRGRLLALFPKKWLPLAIEATRHLPDYEKTRVVEKLVELKRRSSIRSVDHTTPKLDRGWTMRWRNLHTIPFTPLSHPKSVPLRSASA
jgi:hypothetical protein